MPNFSLSKSDRVGRYMDYSRRAYFVYVIFKDNDYFLEFGEDVSEADAKNVLNLLNLSSNGN